MPHSSERDSLEILATLKQAQIPDDGRLVLCSSRWRNPREDQDDAAGLWEVELNAHLDVIKYQLLQENVAKDLLRRAKVSEFYHMAISPLLLVKRPPKPFKLGLFPLHPDPNGVRRNLQKMAQKVRERLKEIHRAPESEIDETQAEIQQKAETTLFNGMRMIFTENIQYLQDAALLFPRNFLQQGEQVPPNESSEENYLTLKEIRKGVATMQQELEEGRKKLSDPEYLIKVKQGLKITSEQPFEALPIHEQDAILNHLEDEAFLNFLNNLKMLSGPNPEGVERRKENIIRIFNEATDKAWKLYRKIGNSVAEAMERMKMGGGRPVMKPSESNKSRRLPGLLCFAFDRREKNKMAQHEAQVVSYYSFLFAMVEMNALHKKAMKRYQRIADRCLSSVLEDPDYFEEITVPIDRNGNFIQGETAEAGKIIKLRKLKKPIELAEGKKIERIILDSVEVKSEDAIIEKILDKGDSLVEGLGDLIRTRIALEGVNTEEFENNGSLRSWCAEMLKDIGSANELHEVYKQKKELKPWEFIIEEGKQKCDGNDEKGEETNQHSHQYFYIKLCAVLQDGLPLEVQILPWDTYHQIDSPDSPTSAKRYKQRKLLELAALQHPQSLYPALHEAAHRVIGEDQKDKKNVSENVHLFFKNP